MAAIKSEVMEPDSNTDKIYQRRGTPKSMFHNIVMTRLLFFLAYSISSAGNLPCSKKYAIPSSYKKSGRET